MYIRDLKKPNGIPRAAGEVLSPRGAGRGGRCVSKVCLRSPVHRGSAYASSRTFRTLMVLNRVLRLIPNIEVSSLTGSPCWYRRRRRFCCAASSFIGLVAARPRATRASREAARRSFPSFQLQLGDGRHDAGDGARPVGVLVSTPSRSDRTWTPRLVSSWRAVATSRTERPSRSTATTTRWSPSRSQPMHSAQPGRMLPARPEAVSVKTRSGVTPAAAIASCCWSMDCCPVDTRRGGHVDEVTDERGAAVGGAEVVDIAQGGTRISHRADVAELDHRAAQHPGAVRGHRRGEVVRGHGPLAGRDLTTCRRGPTRRRGLSEPQRARLPPAGGPRLL